jgi:hypothetical protein
MFQLPAAKPVQTAANKRRITRELLQALPRHERFFQWLDPDTDSGSAFALAGCTLYEAPTFRVRPEADLRALWDNMEGHLRRQVRATRAAMRVVFHNDFQRFVAVSRREHDQRRNAHDYVTLERIVRACLARDQATIVSVATAEGTDAACVILIWGNGTLYYWTPAVDRAKAGSGANALLLWNAIEFAVSKGLTFDTDGYNSGAAGKFFSGFGLPLSWRTGVLHATIAGRLHQVRIDVRAARVGTAPIVHQPRDAGMPAATPPPDRADL